MEIKEKNRWNKITSVEKEIFVQYSIVLIIGIAIYLRMITNSKFTESDAFNYYKYAPNIYRLQLQGELLLARILHISFFLLDTVIFILVFGSIVKYLKPKGKNTLLLYAIMITFIFNPVTTDSLMYVLIVIIAKREKIKAIPVLGIIKELSVWQVVGYYILEKKTARMKVLVLSGLAAIIYLVERIIVDYVAKNNTIVPGGQGDFIFGFPYIIPYLGNKFNLQAQITAVGLLIVAIVVIKTREDVLLMVWNFIPILLFGVWWESQLWVPVFLILFVKNYANEEKGANKSRI